MIHCPHCSRSIESHDGKPCARKFSRRFFFGLMAGAVAAVATQPLAGNQFLTPTRSAYATLNAGDRLVVNFTGTPAELSMLSVLMQNPATGEYHQVEHSVNPLIKQETFYIAPKGMMVADVQWKFATKGSTRYSIFVSRARKDRRDDT